MANFDHLFCINDSGFFFFLEKTNKIRIVFGNDVVGPNHNNRHGSDKRSFT